jgi:hypothetical protein
MNNIGVIMICFSIIGILSFLALPILITLITGTAKDIRKLNNK